ncbi:putative spore germination protein YfkT [Alicyclobacillus hesperidum]|uniref:Spore germination protein (Amino acid permease) n=1 Tax=Alicyclobacillus hesperidum TaxID=89784 RepID=A0A1H2WBM7_9BACL|nr:GerAB/ArcD/ProY family transporter [Alicyclobacillus hesperidum]GLV14529.1 putative spore germination protein YfkT [Alicyclobacillus hesperidum]SDW77439.1 spore germination protein (amino acid permease) [Alicyclobacillus hesperidum]
MSQSARRNAKVPGSEMTAMLIIFVSTNAFLTYPRYISLNGYEAAWMEPVFSGVLTLILFFLVEQLLRRYFKNLDIVEVSKEVFGRFGAILIALVFSLYFLCSTAAVMREFTENVVSTVLPSTPILIVGAVFMFAVGYIVYGGIEGICRTAFIFLPILLVGLVAVCLMTVNWWHPYMLLPLWGTGPEQVLRGSLQYSSIFANVLLLTIIYPHVHDTSKMRRIGFVSIVVSTLLLVGLMLTYHMVFPAAETGKTSFALYRLARMIHLGPFFQRLESIFIFLWVTAATVRMAVTLWGCSYLLGKAFGWPTYRPAVPALVLLSFSLGMWPENWIQVINFDGTYLLRWGWIVVFAIPIAVLSIGAMVRSMRGGGRLHGGQRGRRRMQRV